MQNDKQVLEQLNIEIGQKESQGDRESRNWLAGILAPRLAFQRADRITIDDQVAFLSKVKPNDRRETAVKSIEIYGDRAIVTCVVTLKSEGGDQKFHNIRLFIRYEGTWKLLGWANEAL